jgi:putative transposase
MVLTFRYRVKNPAGLLELARAVNLVWNYCGEVQQHARRWCKRWPSAFDLIQLTRASRELSLHSDAIAAVCLQFVRSRDAFKRRPRWRRSSGSKRSLGWVPFNAARAIKLDGQAAIFQKRRYRLWLHRPIQGKLLCGSFAEDARGRWYLNLQCQTESNLPAGAGEVGIDLGLQTLATLSDGTKVDRQRVTQRYEEKLALAQRAGRKARARAIHAEITNVRKDFLHRASNAIASKYARIVVGNVNASALARSPMAKSVYDAGWSMFRTFLAYKAMRHRGEYVEADEAWTTQACSDCGAIGGPKGIAGLRVREWVCSACGALHNRDVNAAKNLLLGRNVGLQLTESPGL